MRRVPCMGLIQMCCIWFAPESDPTDCDIADNTSHVPVLETHTMLKSRSSHVTDPSLSIQQKYQFRQATAEESPDLIKHTMHYLHSWIT